MKERLIITLRDAGQPVEVMSFPDGTSLLILPFGGRMLGLFSGRGTENYYWTNHALLHADSARALFGDKEWPNLGGERTWLGPEAFLFFPHCPNRNTHRVPCQLDPGDYQVAKTDGGMQLVNTFSLTPADATIQMDLRIVKSFCRAPNPLRDEPDCTDAHDVEYAGYALHSSLEILNSEVRPLRPVGLWTLIQVPHKGELLVPTYGKVIPKVYFGRIPADDLVIDNSLIKYRMRAEGFQKIAIRPASTAGRAGYLYETGDKWALIVRNFTVKPSGHYADVPWGDERDLALGGYAFQAFNGGAGEARSFSELEYHAPAIGGDTGERRSQDTSEVWAFRGTENKMRHIATRLLSAHV